MFSLHLIHHDGTPKEISLVGIIKQKYPNLKGSDWINQIDPEDKAVLLSIMNERNGHGRKGGMARAKTGKRDKNGRFI